jgi:N-acetyl-anhydromuramyl-L-alanine amidase AmpD
MTAYTPKELRRHLRKSGLQVEYQPGWDSREINPFNSGPWAGVVLHHTANGGAAGDHPSLYWMMNNQYKPVRAAHFLIGRSGKILCTSGSGAYHAGAGGPLTLAGTYIAPTQGNAALVGIEIESKGTDPRTDASVGSVDGLTPQQVDAAVKLTVALLDLMGLGVKNVIRHADWTNGAFDGNPRLPTFGRKNDVLQPLSFWRRRIRRAQLAMRAKRLIGR